MPSASGDHDRPSCTEVSVAIETLNHIARIRKVRDFESDFEAIRYSIARYAASSGHKSPGSQQT